MIVFVGRDFNIDSLLCGHSFHRIFWRYQRGNQNVSPLMFKYKA
jgi:hypothetical protein